MSCPRCRGPSDASARSCARCGAPLLLDEEPPPVRLDRALELDRRARLGATPLEMPAVELVEPERVEAARRDDPGGAGVALCGEDGAASPGVPGWRRAAAWGIDAAVVAASAAPPFLLAWRALPSAPGLLSPLVGTAAALAALLGFAYAALAHALMGATVGKRLLGLQVIGPDGGLPSLARSALRSALAILGAWGLGLGVLMALFTKSRRGLHDLLADTVVIRTP